jgi:hypothetical protein
MGAHTPGPWSIRRRVTSINGAAIVSSAVVVARVPLKADKPLYQKEADATLIAAAPDLLAFVRKYDTGCEFEPDEVPCDEDTCAETEWCTGCRARALIAATEGR